MNYCTHELVPNITVTVNRGFDCDGLGDIKNTSTSD